MNNQLSLIFKSEGFCKCGSNYGNQTWWEINDGGSYKYCSAKCLEKDYPKKELKWSLMDFYKGTT